MRSAPQVSCIVPAYNEAATIGDVVRAITSCRMVDEVIVVSDGSTDATGARAVEAGARVLTRPVNGGKGAAVWTALQEASGDILLLLDGDLVGLDEAHLATLLQPVLTGEAEMTVAELRDDRLHELLSSLSGQRALRRRLVAHAAGLAGTGFGLEMALDRLARRQGVKIQRIPLVGLTHRRKRQKYGLVRGLRMQARTLVDLGRQMKRGTIAAAAVLAIASLPFFRAHSTHASPLVLEVPPPVASDRLLVVAAHPDDELIGAGGLIALARAAGAQVTVLILTDGDANKVTAAAASRHLRPGPADFQASGRLRQTEALAAVRSLRLSDGALLFGGFPDRRLDRVLHARAPVQSPFTRFSAAAYPGVQEPGAPYTREALLRLIRSAVTAVHPTIVVTHAPFDAHPDHRATFEAVRDVAGTVRLYAFLVHARGFPSHLHYGPDPALVPPAWILPEGWAWASLDLPPGIRAEKRAGLQAYRSQRSSPYLRVLLPAFLGANELFALPPSTAR